jgi:hypothetical protein
METIDKVGTAIDGISKAKEIFATADFDSLIWIVAVLFVIGLLGHTVKKAINGLAFVCGAVIIVEVGYFLGLSKLNAYFPFSSIFKKDIIITLATVLPGTKLSAAVLYARGVIVALIDSAMQYI